MKQIIAVLALAFASTLVYAGGEAAKETTKVCVDVKDKAGNVVIDPKTKNPKQQCKEMKVHKKLEGTKVPEKK
jgi:hypothetical protein